MTLGERLYQTAIEQQGATPPKELLREEWQDLCALMERAAKRGCTQFILPQDPEAAYPLLAANGPWMRAQAARDGILWRNIQEVGAKDRIWSFSWPLGEEDDPEPECGSKNRTKLRVGKYHLAYVRTDLLLRFRHANGLVNLTPWLRKVIWERFHMEINDAESVKQLQEELERQGYGSCGEWLHELMRKGLRKGETKVRGREDLGETAVNPGV